MKFNSNKIFFNEFLNRNKFVGLIINTIFYLLFFSLRQINKLFSTDNGIVVVIAMHRLGDTIFTIPSIRKIIEQFGTKIIIVCFAESVPIYKHAFSEIEFSIVKRSDFYFQERIATNNIKQKVKALNPRIIFDLTGTMASATLIFSIKAKQIIGINGKWFKGIYDHYIEIRSYPTLTDIYLDAISPIIQIAKRYSPTNSSASISPNGKILIHPYARLKEKEWGFRKFFGLAEKINKDYKVSIIAQTNSINFDIIQEIINSNIAVLQTESTEDLIQGISKCSLFIGNDSGPLNIANFLNKPTFTIYGSTNPEFTATGSSYQIYTQKILNCSAKQNEKLCLAGGEIYQCPGIQCMNLLTIKEIYEDIIPFLKKYCNRKE